MSSRRSLLSHPRASDIASATPSRRRGGITQTAPSEPAATFPLYEPPAFALTDKAKRETQQLRLNPTIQTIETHLQNSVAYLTEGVGAINDAYQNRLLRVREMAARREEKGETEMSDVEIKAEEIAQQLGREAATLSAQLEAAIRDAIDWQAAHQDETAALQSVQEMLMSQLSHQPVERRQRTSGSGDGVESDDGEEGEHKHVHNPEPARPPPPGPRELLANARQTKANLYSRMSMHERYALNNHYIAFRRVWHDAQHPHDEVPLPHASTWFKNADSGGGGGGGAERQDEPGEEDEELQITGGVQSLKCPLTLCTFKEPWSNHLCKHTFEKSAILEMIRREGGSIQCVVSGCSRQLRQKDFYLDTVMLRKIKRAEEAAKRQSQSDDDDHNSGIED